MKHLASALVATFVLLGAAAPASAACTLQGWIDTGQNPKPVWNCETRHQLRSHAGQGLEGKSHHLRHHG